MTMSKSLKLYVASVVAVGAVALVAATFLFRTGYLSARLPFVLASAVAVGENARDRPE